MLDTFLIIKSLFFNIEVSLVKNNMILWYSLKNDNFFSISFK